MTRRTAGGFTLVEMMVVVAIVGVLTTVATVTLRSNVRPVDVAARLSELVHTGSRTAVRHGVVRLDVVAAEGGAKRRTRLVASGATQPTFTLEVLAEDPTPAWHTLASYRVPESVTVVGFATSVGGYTALAPVLSTDWSTFRVDFEPNGSSNSVTLFFSSDHGATMDRKARLSVLPLGTATFVRNAWE